MLICAYQTHLLTLRLVYIPKSVVVVSMHILSISALEILVPVGSINLYLHLHLRSINLLFTLFVSVFANLEVMSLHGILRYGKTANSQNREFMGN